jgi:membrane protein
MAGKKESTYMYNAKMSMRNLSGEWTSSYFGNTKNVISDVRNGYQEVVNGKKSSGFNGIKNRLKQTALFKFASDLTKNAFEGLRTGKFYKSDDDLFGFDESAFDFDFNFDSSSSGGDFFFDDSGDSTPQQATSEPVKDYKGDSATFGAVGKLAKSMSGASKASSNAVINATVEGLFKTAHSINQTIVSANADLKAEIIEQKGYLKGIADTMKEQLGQQQKLVAIQTEMLTEHKAMKEMFSDYMLPKINKKEDDSERGVPEWYNAIRKGSIMQGMKSIGGEAVRAIDMEKTNGMFSIAKAMLPMLLMAYGKNPFKLVNDFVFEPFLNNKFGLGDISKKIERTFSSTQDFINKQFMTMSLSSNPTLKAMGSALMVRPQSIDSIKTDKYKPADKAFFDGATREAIVNVIPTYLSSMVSLLSGKERTVYDYNKGVFRTMSEVSKEYKDNLPTLDYESEKLTSLIERMMDENDKKNLDRDRLEQLSKIIMINLSKNGYDLSSIKNHSYTDAKVHFNLGDNELSESDFYKLRDIFARLETDKSTSKRFYELNKSTKNFTNSRNTYNENIAVNGRMTGYMPLFNGSSKLDSGAMTGFGRNGKETGTVYNYEHPLKAERDQATLKNKDGLSGNIMGTTMSNEELAMVREFSDDNRKGFKIFSGQINTFLKDIFDLDIFKKLNLDNKKWYQDFMSTSPYSLKSIIGFQRKIEEITGGKLTDELLNVELDRFNVTDKDKEKIKKYLADSTLSAEDRKKKIKSILMSSSEFKKKIEELKSIFKKRSGIDIDEKIQNAKNIADDIKSDIDSGEKINNIKNTIKDYANKASGMIKDVTSSGVEKTKEFYEKNKETIWNVSKAAMIGAAGIGIFKTLKKSMVGPIIGMTGLASPIALGAIALGAGIYAYKNNIFDKLFGDNKKAKELREKTGRILKSTLAIGGGIAGISGILSLATPLGFIGPVNAALAGLAISIAGESKGFKRFLFGTEEGSFLSNLKVWMIGDKESGKKGILTKMTEKVTTFFSKGFKSMGRWFKLDVWEPLKSTFKPIKDFMSNTATKIFGGLTGIGDKLTGSFTADFVKPFFAKMKEKVIDPVASFFKKIFGGIFGFLGKIIAAPFKGLRTLITGQTDSSVFASNYGSSNAQVAEKAEYKANMSAKEKLWNDNKYRSLSEIMADDKLSDKDKKTLRKMYAKEATREAEEKAQVQNAKKEDEKDKEGKSGQGIWDTATKYYFNQNKITSKIAGAFMGNSTLCGLAALAQAISAVLDTKIDPSMLAQKSFGWVGSRNGVSPEFMLEVCRKFGIGARYMKNPKADTITKILKKDTIMIVEVDDFETDSLHYLVVRRVEGGVAYYSDPARRKNMAVSIDVLEAKARRAIYLYKKAETSSQVATSAPAVVTTKETEVASTQTGDTLEATSDSSVHKETIFEKAKKFMGVVKDKVTGATSAIADKMSNLTGARGRKKAAEYYTGKKSDLYKLLKDWKKKYQEDTIRLKETIELQTSSLAYNAEYIKRILVKVHGDIPGFGEKDIKNKHFSRIGNWFKRQWRKAKAIPAMVGSLLYNKFLAPIVSFGFKMVKGFKKVLYDFPKWLGAKIWTGFIKPIGGLVVGTIKGIWGAFKNVVGTFKDMAVGFVKGVTTVFRAAVKGLFDGAMYVVKNFDKVFIGIGKLIHHTVKGIGHFIKWGVEAIGTSIKWTVETIGKGIGWLINKAFNFAGFIGKSILGLFGMKRKAALQEVFVVGGTLDSVRIVEVVKSVGAVDLEYAESIERKMGPAGGIIQKAVRAGGNAWQRLIGRRKSPSMKSGDEYAKIDKKQDAEAQQAVALVDGKDGKGKEEKKEASWWEKLLGLGVMGFGLWKSGLLGKILEGLGALKDKIFEMLGIKDNKEEDFKDKPSRDKPAFGYGTLGDVVEWKDELLEKVGVTGSLNRDRERHMAYSSWTHLGLKLGTKVGVTQLAAKGAKKGFKAIAAQIMKEVSEFGASNFAKKLFGKEAKSKLGKVFKMLTDKAVKGAERQVMEGTAEATVRTAAYGVPIAGLLIDGLFALGNFIYGMWNAKDIMGVTKVSWKMRFGVGLASAIYDIFTSKIIFAWIPIVVPLEFLARNIYYYCIADEEEKAAYDEDHKAWEEIKKKEEEEARKAKEAQEKNVKQLQEYSKGFDDGFKTTDTGFFDIDMSAVKTTQVSQADIERMRNQMVKNGEESAQRAQNERARLDARYKKEMEEKARMNKRFGWTDDGGNQVGAGPLAGYGPIKTGIGQIDLALNSIVKPTTEKMAQGATMEEAVTSTLSSPQEMASSLGVSNIREYEAGARNSLTDKLNASIYGSSAEAMRNLNLSAFADNISKMFGIDLNGQNLSSSDGSADGSMGGNSVYTGTPDNRKLQERAKDPKFRKDMQDMWNYASAKWGPDVARNMMAISYSESRWRQDAYNKTGGAAGMFQVIPKYRPAWGFGINEDPRTFSPMEQIARVGPKLMAQLGKHAPSVHNLYAILHYPKSLGYSPDRIVYSKGSLEYSWNHGLDRNKDGHVKAGEVTEFAAEAYPQTKKAALEMGLNGYVVDKFNPYSVSQGNIMASLGATKSQQMGLQQGYGPIKHINQTSNKWNKLSMGGLSFKEAGCGPAVMAMLLDKLDIKYDMQELVSKAIAMKKGAMGGTPMTYFKTILAEHGVASAILTTSVVKTFIKELRAGKSPILLTVSSTGAPHFIIGKEIKNGKLYINDPEKSNSEAITLNDIRLRKAKAILVYKVKGSVKNKVRNMVDTLKGGYGALKSYVMPKLEGFGNAREAIYNTVERMVKQGGYGPTIINNTSSNDISDTSKVVKAISKAQENNKNVTDLLSSIDSNIEKISRGRDNEQIGDNSVLSSILTEVKNTNAYLAKLVELMANAFGGNKNFTVNGRQVMQTIGGIPQPVTNGVSPDTVDFYRTVDRIVRGQAL